VFNEPNLTYEWGTDVDAGAAAGYARLLRAASEGLKAGDPQALVVSAGMANGATAPSLNDLDYLRAFYAAGARGTFDVLDTHPYGGNTPPESTACGGTCFRRAEVQRQIMVEAGDSATPMWATELGWLQESAYDMGPYFEWHKVTAQQQADYLVRAFQYAERTWPWMGPMFVFNHDHSTAMWCGGPCYPPTTSVYWFSVLNPDRSPRPAYTALAAMPKLPASTVRTVPPTATARPAPARTESPTASLTPNPAGSLAVSGGRPSTAGR
jgi:polysaccharide biosynthesis protein PslG